MIFSDDIYKLARTFQTIQIKIWQTKKRIQIKKKGSLMKFKKKENKITKRIILEVICLQIFYWWFMEDLSFTIDKWKTK